MILSENKERVMNFVKEICRQKKVLCDAWAADNSNSLYFRIDFENDENECHVSFRISDHPKKRYIPHFSVFVVSKSSNFKKIERFVNNRIETLKLLSTYYRLETLGEKEGYNDGRISQ